MSADAIDAEQSPAGNHQGEATGDAVGRLAPDARRALVGLLKHGVILASGKRLLYEAICRHREAIAAHLADMYLRLLLDEREGVALLLQQPGEQTSTADDEDDEESAALVVRRTLSVYDTLLLLVLRKHFQEREASGEQAIFIDIEHIEARMSPFLPLTTSTRTERRALSGALDKLTKRCVLRRARGDESRFEITPVIRYVVNAQALEHLLEQYRALLAKTEQGQVGNANGE